MRKIIQILLFLVMPLGILTSCDDDNDLPSVDLSVTFSPIALHDNMLYAVHGDTLRIDRIDVKSLNGKAAAIANVSYYLDYSPLFYTDFAPFSGAIKTEYLKTGQHRLMMRFNILQVDKTIASAQTAYDFYLVSDAEELPGALGSQTITTQIGK